MLEVVYYFHCTNRHALCILVIGEHFGELSCKHTQACIVSRTPFFVDHPTLFVNFFAVECNVVAPVVHDKKTAIDNFNPLVCRSIHYSIYCFVKCSVSIKVCPKLATNALQESNKVLPGEVLRPVECHVLKKVSKTGLWVFFENRTHLLCDVVISTILGVFVVTNNVGQTIGQRTHTYSRING